MARLVNSIYFFSVSRLPLWVREFIFIFNNVFVAGQSKHLEAYDLATSTGDVEFALLNLCQYTNTAIYGCGENLKSLSQNVQYVFFPLSCLFKFVGPIHIVIILVF